MHYLNFKGSANVFALIRVLYETKSSSSALVAQQSPLGIIPEEGCFFSRSVLGFFFNAQVICIYPLAFYIIFLVAFIESGRNFDR